MHCYAPAQVLVGRHALYMTARQDVGYVAPGVRFLQDWQCLGKWLLMIAHDVFSSNHDVVISSLGLQMACKLPG